MKKLLMLAMVLVMFAIVGCGLQLLAAVEAAAAKICLPSRANLCALWTS